MGGSRFIRSDADNHVIAVEPPHESAHVSVVPVQQLPVAGPRPVSREASFVSRLPEVVLAFSWRYRAQLAPLYGVFFTVACFSVSTISVVLFAFVASLLYRWRDRKCLVKKRVILSRRERLIVSSWIACAATTGFSCTVFDVGSINSFLVVGLFVAPSSVMWVNGRAVRTKRMSKTARATISRWKYVSDNGPGPVKGSHVVRGSASEPFDGTVTFTVALLCHALDASTETVRRSVEVSMRSGVGTVQLSTVREDAALMRVTVSRGRAIEVSPVKWYGPVMRKTRDGSWVIDIAQEPSGKTVSVTYADKDGVYHGMITGTTGGGKSSTIAAMLLCGPYAGLSTIFYIDGKRGVSGGYLEKAIDWFEPNQDKWNDVIDATWNIMFKREVRRGAMRLSSWRTGEEDDPIIELWIDEMNSVINHVSNKSVRQIKEIAAHGRALGVRLVQAGQAPQADMVIGGIIVRGLLASGGVMIGHRAIGGTASRLAGDSSGASIELRDLPPEPGFAGIIERSTIVSKCARIKYASPDEAASWARKIRVRSLDGADLDAAGRNYINRHSRDAFTGSVIDGEVVEQEPSDSECDKSILELLSSSDEPMRLGQMEGKIQFSRRQISNRLSVLVENGRVSKTGAQPKTVYSIVRDGK